MVRLMNSDFEYCDALTNYGSANSDNGNSWKEMTDSTSLLNRGRKAARTTSHSYANVSPSEIRAVEQVHFNEIPPIHETRRYFVLEYVGERLDNLSLIGALSGVWIVSAVLIYFFKSYAFLLPLVLSTMYLGSYLLSKLFLEKND